MLKLLSRQVPKALRHPFRPLPTPLCDPLQTRLLYTKPVPFQGPPSYATLARRFSPSSPNPIRFFAQKEAKEAIERGEFINIHDISGVDPKDYDVLITDINNDTLHSDISKLMGIPYLKEATKDEADKVAKEIHGFFYGQKRRMILPCVVSAEDNARWVFFIVDPGSLLTFISSHVIQALDLNQNQMPPWDAKIAGYPHPIYMSPPDSHFSEVNLLGVDFCSRHALRPWYDAHMPMITYYIGNKWKKPELEP